MAETNKKTYALPVQISRIEGTGYRAECTILPGCFVDGDTLEEVLADIQEAIVLYIEASREQGLLLPEIADFSGSVVLTIIPVAVPS